MIYSDHTTQANKSKQSKAYLFSTVYAQQKFSVIPLKPKDKVPALKWDVYMKKHAELTDLKAWFGNGKGYNLAVVCGTTSGGLVVLDFDTVDAFYVFEEKAKKLKWAEKLSQTWRVKTGRGYHLYLLVESKDPDLLKTRPNISEKIDIKGEGGYVVAPPSVHPSGAIYRFEIGPEDTASPQKITESEYRELLSLLEGKEKSAGQEKKKARRKKKSIAKKITEILSSYYEEGRRDEIVFYLSGALKKADFSYEETKEIIEHLVTEKMDEEATHRLYVVKRTYGLAGSPPNEDELKGLSGLKEILDKSDFRRLLRALNVSYLHYTRELPSDQYTVLKAYSRFPYQIIIDHKEKIVEIASDKGPREVLFGIPRSATLYIDPLDEASYLVELTWSFPHRDITLGPAEISSIATQLQQRYGVSLMTSSKAYIHTLLWALINSRMINVRRSFTKPGFYKHRSSIVSAEDVQKPSKEELKKAIQSLEYFRHSFRRFGSRFAVAVAWGLAAPWVFAKKQQREKIWLPHLYLVGDKRVGKTSLAEVITSLYGQHRRYPGSSITTLARLGEKMSLSTFPVQIDEPGHALSRLQITETIKAATEQKVGRERIEDMQMRQIRALSLFCFTSNVPLPHDGALQERFLELMFFSSEAPSKEEREIYDREYAEHLKRLKAIGAYVSSFILAEPQTLFDAENLLLMSVDLLKRVYREIGEECVWIDDVLTFSPAKVREEHEEDMREAFRSWLYELLYSAHKSQKDLLTAREVLAVVLKKQMVPYVFARKDEVIITSALLPELRRELPEWAVSISHLARRLGWEYKKKKVGGRSLHCVVVRLDDFLDMLCPEEDEDEAEVEAVKPVAEVEDLCEAKEEKEQEEQVRRVTPEMLQKGRYVVACVPRRIEGRKVTFTSAKFSSWHGDFMSYPTEDFSLLVENDDYFLFFETFSGEDIFLFIEDGACRNADLMLNVNEEEESIMKFLSKGTG